MKSNWSRRELYALGETLGDCVTERKLGGGYICGGGGKGGGSAPSQTTAYQTNLPEYAKPYVTTMLEATQKQLFNTTPGADGTTEITGFKPYTPYSSDPTAYFAGPSSLTTNAYNEAAGMQTPGQFGQATTMAGQAGAGGLDTVGRALGYGGQGFQSGMMGQGLGIQGGGYYGGMGAGYGQQGADIGLMGLRAERTGQQIGRQAQDYARQAAMAGQQYARQATDPNAIAQYMSPYQQQVTDVAKAAAVREAQIAQQQANLGSARQGTYGGARQALAQSERERNLLSNLANIQAQGSQSAYDKAMQSMQYGSNLGLQGLAGAQQGLGTALQGGQLGLSGIGTALQGTAQGMQGAGVGLQGVNAQLAGTAQGMQGAGVGLQGVQGAQAGYNLANQAASNLANIGTQEQQADLARMGFQNQLGQQQQAYQQNIINQAIQDYATAQQYPMMQLGFMSNMLRGLPLQATTTQSYMPTPNLATQAIAGLGTAAGAYKAFGMKKGGKVPKYAGAEGSVVSSMKAKLEAMADTPGGVQQVAKIAQTSPSVEMRSLANEVLMEKQLEQRAAQQAEQSIQQDQAKGLAEVPAPVMDTMAAAGGGIVAFADEGEVEYDPTKVYNDPYQVLSDAEAFAIEEGRRKKLGIGEVVSPQYREYLAKQTEGMPGYKNRLEGLEMMKTFSRMNKPGRTVDAVLGGLGESTESIAKMYETLRGREAEIAKGEQDIYGKERAEKLGVLTGVDKRRADALKALAGRKEKEISAASSRETFTDRLAAQYFKDLVVNQQMDPNDPATKALAMKQAIYDFNLAGGKLNLQSEAAIIKGEKDSKELPRLRRELLQLEPGTPEYTAKQAEIQKERDKIRADVESKTPGRPEAPKPAEKKDGSGRFPEREVTVQTPAGPIKFPNQKAADDYKKAAGL